MNGLATLLAPGGEAPEVKGLTGRPPGSAETSTETDGFIGILQQMMVGCSLQMASTMSMLPLLTVQDSGGGGNTTSGEATGGGATGGSITFGSAADGMAAWGNSAPVPNPQGGSIIPFIADSIAPERPEIPVFPQLSPTDSSPPGKEKAVLSDPAPTVNSAKVKEDLVLPVVQSQTDVTRPSFSFATVAQESMKEGPEASKKPQSPAIANPVQAEVVDADVPGPGAGKAVPAGAVIPARPAAEPESHQGDTGKNLFHHTPMQFTPVKASLIHGEPSTPHVPDFLTTLSAETARNVIDQVVKEAVLQVRGDTAEMRIRLEPASLGEVTLNVRMEKGQLQAQIDVSNAAVKTALDSNLGQLRLDLNSHGIDVQQLDIYFGGHSTARDAGSDRSEHYRRQDGKRDDVAVEAVDRYATGRLLGYNTMEVVM